MAGLNPPKGIRALTSRVEALEAGGSVSVVVDEDDPGAVGAGTIWVEVKFGPDDGYSRMWFRNSANDGWNPLSPLTWQDDEQTIVGSPNDVSEIALREGTRSYVSAADPGLKLSGGSTAIYLDDDGFHLLADTGPIITVGLNRPDIGAGVVAPTGSLYLRKSGVSSIGEAWIKYDTGDTNWTQLLAVSTLVQDSMSITASGHLTLQGSLVSIVATDPTPLITLSLPESDPLANGALWNDAGTVKVSAG